MASPIDLLNSQLLPVQSHSLRLEQAATAAVLSATVISSKLTAAVPLSNTLTAKQPDKKPSVGIKNLLPNNTLQSNALAGSKQGKTSSDQLFQILLSTIKGNFIVSSKVPLSPGTAITVKMTEQGLVLTVKPESDQNNPTKALLPEQSIKPPAGRNTQTRSEQYSASNTIKNSRLQSTYLSQQPTVENKTPQTQEIIDNGIRQALPIQQSVRLLVPLLQQLSLSQGSLHNNNDTRQLTKSAAATLKFLLQQIPTSNTIQNPQNLKSAIKNSGIFMEAKLAQANGNNYSSSVKTANGTINTDIKALSQKLLDIINKTSMNKVQIGKSADGSTPVSKTETLLSNTTTTDATQGAGKTSSITRPSVLSSTSITINTSVPLSDEQAELAIPLQSKEVLDQNNLTQLAARAAQKNIDITLRQLGRQLLASLAKTQLNQLESLSSRAINNPDNQGSNNSWTLEIPIINGKHIDNLELRIDQQQESSEDQQEEKNEEKLWTVMLDFDLHALGKMSVQLKIVANSVSAIIWSQLEITHKEVKQHLNFLHQSLEKIGIKVQQVKCELGLPPKTQGPLQRQLVDVRT